MRFMNHNFSSDSTTVVSASSQDSNFPASNLKNPFRSVRWRSTSVADQWVKFDLVTTEEVNSVCILWPTEDGIRLSETAVIKVQANATDEWSSPAVDQVLVVDDTYMVASHFFSTDQTYRYWRVTITDPGNPYGFLELGKVWLGRSLEISAPGNGFKFQLNDQSKQQKTPFGHVYTDEYPTLSKLSFSYQYLDYDDARILEDAFRMNGGNKPVLAVLDEAETMFSKNHFLIYGLMGDEFNSAHVKMDLFDSDITITELA